MLQRIWSAIFLYSKVTFRLDGILAFFLFLNLVKFTQTDDIIFKEPQKERESAAGVLGFVPSIVRYRDRQQL